MRSRNQTGNALFLILIAVILFAALSYAITKSENSSSNAVQDAYLIAGTTALQFTDAIHSGVMKMVINGITVSELDFTAPNDSNFNTAPLTAKVFHPSGGDVVWQNVDPNVVELDASNQPIGQWHFLKDKAIAQVGSSQGEVIALLTHVKSNVCLKMDEQVTGMLDITIRTSYLTLSELLTDGTFPLNGKFTKGKHFFCVSTTDSPEVNVFYQVLVPQ